MSQREIAREILSLMSKRGLESRYGTKKLETEWFDWRRRIDFETANRFGQVYKNNKQDNEWHEKPAYQAIFSKTLKNLIRKDLVSWVKMTHDGFVMSDSEPQCFRGITLTPKGQLCARRISVGTAPNSAL